MVIKAYCFGATRTELFHSSLTGTSLDSSMGLKKKCVCEKERERGRENKTDKRPTQHDSVEQLWALISSSLVLCDHSGVP